jgi:hypothetical protein
MQESLPSRALTITLLIGAWAVAVLTGVFLALKYRPDAEFYVQDLLWIRQEYWLVVEAHRYAGLALPAALILAGLLARRRWITGVAALVGCGAAVVCYWSSSTVAPTGFPPPEVTDGHLRGSYLVHAVVSPVVLTAAVAVVLVSCVLNRRAQDTEGLDDL